MAALGPMGRAAAADSLSWEHSPVPHLVGEYCLSCHSTEKQKGELDLESLLAHDFNHDPALWGDVLWMLQGREMPPADEPDAPRPTNAEYATAVAWLESAIEQTGAAAPDTAVLTSRHELVQEYCINCHGVDEAEGGLVLESISAEPVAAHPEIWENVVRRLRARQMPPAERPRPNEATYDTVLASLIDSLDAFAAEYPNPGRTETFRRLTRTEYQNAIRDLLALEIDASKLLPKDEEAQGFDNITVGDLSPTVLDRYVSAAQKISRLALGTPHPFPDGEVVRIRPDVTQEERVAGLPVGTRGGALIPHHFPRDGEYEIRIRLARDRNDNVESLFEPHEVELLIDRERIELFTVQPPAEGEGPDGVDAHLRALVTIAAGPHDIGVTFLKNPSSLLETQRQPYNVHYNFYRHPRISPAIYQVTINGPFASTGPGDTPSRQRILIAEPSRPEEEDACARKILSTLMRRAYRRPVTDEDLKRPMAFFRQARAEDGFEAGIEMALSAILVSPQFLFRIERDPMGVPPETTYRISDLELASRLSFFLWSSIPDDALLDAAIDGELSRPEVLARHTRRMLADVRARNFVTNFAGQWLYLRNLEAVTPDMRLFTDFDDNLRQAFRQETELFFESIWREDRSVLDLLDANYTYLNERLAKHYGIPHVYGTRFRRVELPANSVRGGLLRHGSILTVTSYATRTSPVIRGNWVLENLIGTPAPPPPPDVPALEEVKVSASLPVRERLAAHRANPACASCHNIMDPVGFALENFDAIGRWRTDVDGQPLDVSGGLPDGSEFEGVEGLEASLLARPEIFVGTMTEKLLTFALGRGVEYYDAPAVRQIVRDAQAEDHRFSALVLGIVNSTPFQNRKTP